MGKDVHAFYNGPNSNFTVRGSRMSEHSDGHRGQGHGGGNRRPSGNTRGNGGNRGFKGRSDSGNNRGFNGGGRGGNHGGGRGRFSRDGDDNRRGGYRGGNDRRDDRRGGYRGGYRDGDDNRRGGYRGGSGRRDDRRGGQGGRGGDKKFQHANRGGANRAQHSGPQRSGYREERLNKRLNEPQVPADLDPRDLDPSVRQELRSLSKDNADMVAKHLIMAAMLLDEDVEKALAHARAAKDRAGRVSVARETNGIAAYHAGEWKEAISELRAARRMSGGPGLLAVLADAERGLGRPEKALEVAREDGAEDLEPESRIELAIVVAGAHHDLGNNDDALVSIEDVLDVDDVPDVSRLRLYYAYADALVIAGRKEEAIEWFERASDLDHGELTDIPVRLEELQAEGK